MYTCTSIDSILPTSLTVKFWLLEYFNLSNVHIVKRVDGLTAFLNVFTDTVGNPADEEQTAMNPHILNPSQSQSYVHVYTQVHVHVCVQWNLS